MSTGNWNFPYLKRSYTILCMAWCHQTVWNWGDFILATLHPNSSSSKKDAKSKDPFWKSWQCEIHDSIYGLHLSRGCTNTEMYFYRNGFLFAIKYFVDDLKSKMSVITKPSCFVYLYLFILEYTWWWHRLPAQRLFWMLCTAFIMFIINLP